MSSKKTYASILAIAVVMAMGCDDGETAVDGGPPPTDAASATDAGQTPTNTIVDVALSNPDFSMLVSAATRAGLVDTLSSPGPFTIFAPTNAAFMESGISQADLDAIPVSVLTQILTYHALVGRVDSSMVTAGPVETVAGLTAFIGTEGGVTINGGNMVVGGATVQMPDVAADNGVIHVIDRLLLPPTVADLAIYGGLTDLVGAIGAAAPLGDGTSVLDALRSREAEYTVFAPTNAAFAALEGTPEPAALRDVLLYHVVPSAVGSASLPASANSLLLNRWGNGVTLLLDTSDGANVNGASIALTDLRATNGVVHVIDEVLLPPNVVDMVGIAGLSELGEAVGAAAALPDSTPVGAALQGDGPLTVFAPNDAAFEAAASVVAGLNAEQVRDVLLFHVVGGSAPVLSTDLSNAEVDTLFTDTLTVDVSSTPPTVEGQDVLAADINVTNGVVHVIGGVMVPPSFSE